MPYNITDIPLISDWLSEESNKLVQNVNDSIEVNKAVFVYDNNRNLLHKYKGVTEAQKSLNINHCIIKKHAILGASYGNYIFSYERIVD